MNHTLSGAIANGAPMSLARLASEARQAQDNVPQLLLLTEEGKSLLHRAARSVGNDPTAMTPESWAEFLDREITPVHHFLNGILHAFEML